LKEIFTSEPVLAAPDLDKEMRVEADVSDYATGGVLLVTDREWQWCQGRDLYSDGGDKSKLVNYQGMSFYQRRG